MKYTTIINGKEFIIEIEGDGTLIVNGEKREVDFLDMGNSLFSIITNLRSIELAIDHEDNTYEVLVDGRMYEGQVFDERALFMAKRRGALGGGSGEVKAPMPGLVVDVPVALNEVVSEGQTVVVLESMKMQNELKAPRDGIIQEIHCKHGSSVEKNALLIVVGEAE